ncbi:cytochrome b/b6 domain-containing protein [Burkholderia pseudomallei]|uniref:cytochrome b/b6 domain-containing protein n=1 Tax=Burkholderia pseudomallei TaxID=28450 RepID=UPI0019E87427|nr:cytochrome b/b6 domain-containing protein [Burkholderia pseudomallei]MBF4106064.1 cytochrome b/b6 domain-containing protein [Burkholderia pseudomallei]MBO7773657.1 cytochrome b/b6 domain-containing protein [Burkholderia pseudomallei]MBO7889346.1 cytochrome b/b6 domain-containing protein [Burkholderia pseudomallei]MBO7894667.1 cytochrome b/b6 domain-containing protein [Burkholderia pseudomallei]MBO7900621.1 cytochrome b/b6 domain-containing protein [Burkholderia pseudomallei]
MRLNDARAIDQRTRVSPMSATPTTSASTTAMAGARASGAADAPARAPTGADVDAGATAWADATANATANATTDPTTDPTIDATTDAMANVTTDAATRVTANPPIHETANVPASTAAAATTEAVAGARAGAALDAAHPGATQTMSQTMAQTMAQTMTQTMTQAGTEAASPAGTDAAASGTCITRATRARRPIHPLWVRASHWLNALAAVTMALSGWRIYNASPIYAGFVFPRGATLGGWLGGALQWHFAAMWLLFFNGVFYLTMGVATGRFTRKLLPLSASGVARDLRDALRGRLSHDDLSVYNALQRAAYVAAIADLALLVLSGLVIWKSVQFPLLREWLGGYDRARVVHFWAMAFLVAFFVVHVAMAALVPRSLLAMLRGH